MLIKLSNLRIYFNWVKYAKKYQSKCSTYFPVSQIIWQIYKSIIPKLKTDKFSSSKIATKTCQNF